MGLVVKLVVAQFINTAVIITLVNAKIPALPTALSGEHSDYTPLWYTQVRSAGIDSAAVVVAVAVVAAASQPLLLCSALL